MTATTITALARTTEPNTALRRFLALDAIVTGANGLAYLAASGPLADLLGVGRTLLLELGAFLTVYAVAVGALGSRRRPARLPAQAVVEANLAWSALSVAALGLWLSPTTAGTVWTVLQALTVTGFALLQYAALKNRQDISE
ncbi:hypothetical protein [Streptomyces sp. enrichment culture]|uniref:hypothetical protein n=1 Tax=Streptomyces sp. enrichment culture TaxID=1795815 RepID=UPI003F573660